MSISPTNQELPRRQDLASTCSRYKWMRTSEFTGLETTQVPIVWAAEQDPRQQVPKRKRPSPVAREEPPASPLHPSLPAWPARSHVPPTHSLSRSSRTAALLKQPRPQLEVTLGGLGVKETKGEQRLGGDREQGKGVRTGSCDYTTPVPFTR